METASLKFKHIIELASKESTVINRPYKVLLHAGLRKPGSKEPWCSLYENASRNMFVFYCIGKTGKLYQKDEEFKGG